MWPSPPQQQCGKIVKIDKVDLLSFGEEEQRIIKEFASAVKQAFRDRLKKILLFGSRARGDAEEDSDYDFLVLLETIKPSDKDRLMNIAAAISLERTVVILPVLIEADEFTEDRYFYFYENVMKEGIEV